MLGARGRLRRWSGIGLPKIAEQQVAEHGYSHNAEDNPSPAPPITAGLNGEPPKEDAENHHREKLGDFGKNSPAIRIHNRNYARSLGRLPERWSVGLESN